MYHSACRVVGGLENTNELRVDVADDAIDVADDAIDDDNSLPVNDGSTDTSNPPDASNPTSVRQSYRLNTPTEDACVCQFLNDHPYIEFYRGVRLYDPVLYQQNVDVRVRAGVGVRSGVRQSIPVNARSSSSSSSSSSNTDKVVTTDRFKFIEVFAGIGGFRLGLEAIGGRCVLASEIDEDAQYTYKLNFNDTSDNSTSTGNTNHGVYKDVLIGDISEHPAEEFPSFDILTAGFPCQSFSIRGDQRGLEDPRGQLYMELVRILKAKKPSSFLFENVSRLVTHNGGKMYKRGESREHTGKGSYGYI